MNESDTFISNTNRLPESILSPLAKFLTAYYQIFIITIGLFGNTLTILLFSTTKLTHLRRTRFYLINLAFSDTGYLLIILFQYLDSNEILLTISNYAFICKSSVYVTYIFNFLSCGLVLTFTVQRFCSICFPLSINMSNMERRSKIFIVILLLFSFLFYSFSLFLFDLEIQHEESTSNNTLSSNNIKFCKAKHAFENTVERLNFFDSLFTLVIPFLGLLIMNALIVRTLKNSNNSFQMNPKTNLNNQNRQFLPNEPSNKDANSDCSPKKNKKSSNWHKKQKKKENVEIFEKDSSRNDYLISKNKNDDISHTRSDNISENGSIVNINHKSSQIKNRINTQDINCADSRVINSKTNAISRKVTKMLIVLSTTFLILNLPIHSFNIYINIRILLTKKEFYYPIESDLKEIFDSIFYTSFSCNFFLYSISGVSFRTELKELFLRIFRLN
jgi:hypothetical protein